MPDFIPGLQLAERFYHELIQPMLAAEYPQLLYAAALIGSGSEVQGFDTPMSTDHHWGPRAMVFLSADDKARYAQPLYDLFRRQLPTHFYGYPTGFGNPDTIGVRLLDEHTQAGAVDHRVEILTLADYMFGLPEDRLHQPLTPADWLLFSEQQLLEVTGGAVFHDGIGDLTRWRQQLAYYPPDIWFYRMAAIWARISEEEHFMGRTGDVGDDIGSRLLAARLVRDLMRLGFLIERRYAPYPKWFGTAFTRLNCAAVLKPLLEGVLAANDWRSREQYLSQAYQHVAELHNQLNVTPPLATEVQSFFGRPYGVIYGGRFADALIQQINDAAVRQVAERTLIGAVDQFSDSTAFLTDSRLRTVLRGLYE